MNSAMMKVIKDNSDPEALSKIAGGSTRELWDVYGIKENSRYKNYVEFVTDVGFQTAEIGRWLDELEAAGLAPDEYFDR